MMGLYFFVKLAIILGSDVVGIPALCGLKSDDDLLGPNKVFTVIYEDT